MILADTSIWIDHLRSPEPELIDLAAGRLLYCHAGVIGELACGNLADRHEMLTLLKGLFQAPVAEAEDVLIFIERNRLMGRGVGYLDMQLLASAAMQPGRLWTRDRRLREVAESLGLSYAALSG